MSSKDSAEKSSPTHLTARLNVKAIDSKGRFEGYASIFGVVDEGRDIVLPGAFKRSIAERGTAGVRLLWQHDPSTPIGAIESLTEDDLGLHIRARLLLDVEKAGEAYALMQAGALDGLSIGFRTLKSKNSEEEGVRLLEDVDLWEISLVTFPMQPGARISSFKAAAISTPRQFEAFLRDAGGFSRTEAKAITAAGFDALATQREAGADWAQILESIESLECQFHTLS